MANMAEFWMYSQDFPLFAQEFPLFANSASGAPPSQGLQITMEQIDHIEAVTRTTRQL